MSLIYCNHCLLLVLGLLGFLRIQINLIGTCLMRTLLKFYDNSHTFELAYETAFGKEVKTHNMQPLYEISNLQCDMLAACERRP